MKTQTNFLTLLEQAEQQKKAREKKQNLGRFHNQQVYWQQALGKAFLKVKTL